MSPAGRAASRPRVVFVTRQTRLEVLLAVHGTLGQARFYLESRGQEIEPLLEQQARFDDALRLIQQELPADQRRTRVDRDALHRFLFAPDDVVLIVGQDGLVPNTAKYLRGQLTAGVNPDPQSYEGVLCRHSPEEVPLLLGWVESGQRDGAYRLERRVMAQAQREDGQHLLALNEIFVGHETHQSARYRICTGSAEERQSSSGVIVSTGTGASGWARSIVLQRQLDAQQLPQPDEERLAWFVREPWPSVSTGAALNFGLAAAGAELLLHSEMGEGGVAFADGIEGDRLSFNEGQSLRINIAEHRLNLIVDEA